MQSPTADPASLDLAALFRDARMFESRAAWNAVGFRVVNRTSSGKIMVAQHPSAPGLLFKKYSDAGMSPRDQRQNYDRRAKGAERLRDFVDKRDLSRLVVPRKWVVELPRRFARRDRAYILIVEQLDILDDGQTYAAYQRVDRDVLEELCVVLFHFRGMDSNAKNLPFTTDGRIALIDTEHWDRGSSKGYLHHIGEHLSVQGRKLAKKIFARLEDGEETAEARDFDFDDEDDTSASSRSSDFFDEDDTSSSSSSESS